MLGRILDIREGGIEHRLVTDRKPYTAERTEVSIPKKNRKKTHTPAEHKWDELFEYPRHTNYLERKKKHPARIVGYLFLDTKYSKYE